MEYVTRFRDWLPIPESAKSALRPAFFLGFWFICNATMVITNKWIFQRYHFNFPMTLTCIHMFFCFVGAYLMIHILKFQEPVYLSWGQIINRIAPLCCVYTFNIILGNISLLWIHISFMQTVKSSVPAFTACLQFLFLGTRLKTAVYATLVPVVGGVILATATEVNFHMGGFLCCLLASALTAGYSILSGKILSGVNKMDSTNLIYYMSPIAFCLLLPIAAFTEFGRIAEWLPKAHTYHFTGLAFNGFVALLLNLSTFLAIANTSPLTCNVAGNLKSVINIIASVAVFHNVISPLNGVGCGITIIGVLFYNYLTQAPAKPTTLPTNSTPQVNSSTGTPQTQSPLQQQQPSSTSSLVLTSGSGEAAPRGRVTTPTSQTPGSSASEQLFPEVKVEETEKNA